jgi:hypothetical protein
MKPLHYIGLAVVLLFGVYGLKAVHYRSTTVPLSSVTRTLSVIHTQTVCEVHQVKLQKDVVPISYGLMSSPDFQYLNAQKNLFPHSRQKFNGGCVIDEYRYAEVLYCEQCRKAEKQWRPEPQIPQTNTPPVPPMPPQPTPDPRFIAASRPATPDEMQRADHFPPGSTHPGF